MKNQKKIIKWGAMIFFVYVIVLGYVLLKESERAERGETYRQQLTALCAVMDKALTQGYEVKEISPKKIGVMLDDPEDFLETAICLKAIRKSKVRPEAEIIYTIYYDGKVIINRSDFLDGEYQIEHVNWGNHPEFSKIGKK